MVFGLILKIAVIEKEYITFFYSNLTEKQKGEQNYGYYQQHKIQTYQLLLTIRQNDWKNLWTFRLVKNAGRDFLN